MPQDPHCINCQLPMAKCECVKEPEPGGSEPIMLHPQVAQLIYSAYMAHTTNRKKAAQVALDVLALVARAYEQEVNDGKA